jgi:L-seryl-tRNA(Ser) seleniumtransferase
VVNNNAGAVLLVLNTLAEGREVVVSRGELIEIGGSFRLPEVMEKSGAILREVGTTNRTYIQDYFRAIEPQTALLLRAHPSNYRIEGFSTAVSRSELVALGREKGLPVFEDLGSGLIVHFPDFDSSGEPVVPLVLREGVNLVSFSGDKLLGGPQAGIILGQREFLELIRKNPLTRALRIDKLTLAGLEATLRIYREGGLPPVISALRIPLRELKNRARRLARGLRVADPLGRFRIKVVEEESAAGGGSLPGVKFSTLVVSFHHPTFSPEEISQAFRSSEPPVIGRIKGDCFLLDLRTILPDEIREIIRAFAGLSQRGEAQVS